MKRDVSVVHNSRNAADYFFGPQGEKILDRRVLVKGVGVGVQLRLEVKQQGGNPGRLMTVQAFGQAQEGAQRRAAPNRDHPHGLLVPTAHDSAQAV